MQIVADPSFNVKAKTNAKLSALSYSVLFGRPKLVKSLLSKQADPNICDSFGRTCLMNAALTNQPEICALLLDAGCERNKKNKQGRTAIDLAIDKQAKKCAVLMNKKGCECAKNAYPKEWDEDPNN